MTRFFLALASFVLASMSAVAATSPETIANQIKSSSLQADRAIHVSNVTLHAGAATITLADGTLVPASAVGDRAVEAVFIGRGTFAVKPDDPVEAGQLELFTSAREMNETVTEAVFVAPGAEMAALMKGTPSTDAAAATRAQVLYGEWKSGADRKLMGVDSRILAAVLGDENATRYFAARLRCRRAGEFDFVIDPAEGNATLGQFVAAELTDREQRREAGRLNKEHRRGRSLGTQVTDEGHFNVWSEFGAPKSQGEFEPDAYHLDVTVSDAVEHLGGRATIDLNTIRGSHRVVVLGLHEDQQVSQVTDGAGKPLFFLRSPFQLAVVLPEAPEAGKHFSITVAFDGAMFDKEGRDFRLREPAEWYPHAGWVDHAKYEVTLHWPAGVDLLAAGKRVDGGDHWEKRVLDIPVDGYSLEVGHFSIETIQAGHVNIRLAFDPESEDRRQVAKALQNDTSRRNRQIDFRARGITAQGREEIRRQLRDSLLYFEQLFGPYALDELTVVTVPRDYSLSMPGLISLSTDMMTDPGTEISDAFRASVDRRLIVAHEVAHQWWGELVWTNARDHWIEEAIASYAAGEYGRNKLDWAGRYQINFTTRWPLTLMRAEHGTRPIEAIGPVVLGGRLSSSRSRGAAYVWITYEKGALIMDMLAQAVGEQRFQSILRDIVSHESKKVISTETFLDYLSRGSGRDLKPLASYFIYGTGIPEIEYRAAVAHDGGKWTIHLTGERVDPWWYRVHIVKQADGKRDVVRAAVPVTAAPAPPLVVPLQVALEQPGAGGQLKYAKKNIDVVGGNFKIDIDIPWEPKDVALDRDHEVLALLYSEAHNRKQVLLQRGLHLVATGKRDDAERTFKEALAAKKSTEVEAALNAFGPVPVSMPVGVELGQYKPRVLDLQDQITDSALRLLLARLYIDEGKDAEAGSELGKADRALERDLHYLIDDEIALLQSRIDVRAGAYKGAFDRLSKLASDDPDGLSAEGYALLAVAAKQTGDAAELKKATDHARVLGVDVSSLD